MGGSCGPIGSSSGVPLGRLRRLVLWYQEESFEIGGVGYRRLLGLGICPLVPKVLTGRLWPSGAYPAAGGLGTRPCGTRSCDYLWPRICAGPLYFVAFALAVLGGLVGGWGPRAVGRCEDWDLLHRLTPRPASNL